MVTGLLVRDELVEAASGSVSWSDTGLSQCEAACEESLYGVERARRGTPGGVSSVG